MVAGPKYKTQSFRLNRSVSAGRLTGCGFRRGNAGEQTDKNPSADRILLRMNKRNPTDAYFSFVLIGFIDDITTHAKTSTPFG